MNSAKNGEKINKFYFNHQYGIIEAVYATSEFVAFSFGAKSLGRVSGDFMGYKVIIKHIYNMY